MNSGTITTISVLCNVIIVAITSYSQYQTGIKMKELEYNLKEKQVERNRQIDDFTFFLKTSGRVTSIIEKQEDINVEDILHFDEAVFAILIYLTYDERQIFLDFRNVLKMNIGYPDNDNLLPLDLTEQWQTNDQRISKSLKKHRSNYYRLLNNCIDIAYEKIKEAQ